MGLQDYRRDFHNKFSYRFLLFPTKKIAYTELSIRQLTKNPKNMIEWQTWQNVWKSYTAERFWLKLVHEFQPKPGFFTFKRTASMKMYRCICTTWLLKMLLMGSSRPYLALRGNLKVCQKATWKELNFYKIGDCILTKTELKLYSFLGFIWYFNTFICLERFFPRKHLFKVNYRNTRKKS